MFLHSSFGFVLHFSCFNGCVGWSLCLWLWAWNGLPRNTYISMYARKNRCYNERGSRANYVFGLPDGCLYIQYMCSWRAHWQNVVSSLPSTIRRIWVVSYGHHAVCVGVYCVNIMTVLNIRKPSFQLTEFSNISVTHAHNFDSGVVSTIYC